jgi:DtxR family Mn-dependent transcriptional regulator
MSLSSTEENYIKAIYKLSGKEKKAISTNSIALAMNTAAASVTDMLKRLKEKGYIHHEKYKGTKMLSKGMRCALVLLRKHRLWETFMVEKLNFNWDEVHIVAEQLEHIQSEKLIDSIDAFLGFPKFDPHGDPIPDKNGHVEPLKQTFLSELEIGAQAVIVGVKEHSSPFLQYLEKMHLILGTKVEVITVFEYDNSLLIKIKDSKECTLSHKVAKNLFISLL